MLAFMSNCCHYCAYIWNLANVDITVNVIWVDLYKHADTIYQ